MKHTSEHSIGLPKEKRSSTLTKGLKATTIKIDGNSLVVGGRRRFQIEKSSATLPLDVAAGIRLEQLPKEIHLIIQRDGKENSGVIRMPEIMIQKSSENRVSTMCYAEFKRADWQGVFGIDIWARLWETSVKFHPEFDRKLYIFGVLVDKTKVMSMLSMAFECETVYEAFIFTEVELRKFEHQSVTLQRELIAKIKTIGASKKKA